MSRLTVGEVFPADDPVARWLFVASHWLGDLWSVEAVAEQHARALSFDFPFFFRLLLARLYEGERIVGAARRMVEVAEFVASLPPEAVASFDQWEAAFLEGKGSWAYEQLKKPRNLVSHYFHPDGKELPLVLDELADREVTFVVDERVKRVRLFTADEAVMMASFETDDPMTTARELMPAVAEIRRNALAVIFPAQEHYFAARGIRRDDIVLRLEER